MKRKTVKKVIYFLVAFPAILIASGWIYMTYFMKIDTAEVDKYYEILSKQGKAPRSLVYKLDLPEDAGLQKITDKLKNAMGLDNYSLWVGYGEKDNPPAFITTISPGIATITVSKKVRQKREQINVLIHELSHIYVWDMDRSLLKGCDEEKLVDCTGVFLGLGILMLNGLTDEIFFMPGTDYYTEKKMYGYIRPEQLGYLLARYCSDRRIDFDKVMPFLGPAGKKYFKIGVNYIKRPSQ